MSIKRGCYSQASNASRPFSLPIPLSFMPPLANGSELMCLRRDGIYIPWRAWIISVVRVDPNQPCLNLSRKAMSAREVLCPQRRAEAILAGVGQRDTVSFVLIAQSATQLRVHQRASPTLNCLTTTTGPNTSSRQSAPSVETLVTTVGGKKLPCEKSNSSRADVPINRWPPARIFALVSDLSIDSMRSMALSLMTVPIVESGFIAGRACQRYDCGGKV